MVFIVGMVLSACSPSAPATQEIQPTATETLIPIATDTPGPTMTPSITPTPVLSYAGKLVYASNQDGDYEIFVITAQTEQPEQLTHNDTDDRHPAISPDGSQIAFVSRVNGRYKLFTMNQDGSNLTPVYEHDELNVYDPKWSPDGTKIVTCIGNREIETKTCDIFVIDLASGEATQITNLGYAICPEWSPDGQKLAFSANYEGKPTVLITDAIGGEYFMPEESDRWHLCPHWMPAGGADLLALLGIQGRVLVYTAFRSGSLSFSSNVVPSIMMATDGGRREVIPTHFSLLTEATSWTPDGMGLIIERIDDADLGTRDIYLAELHINLVLTEENLIQLTNAVGVDETDSNWGP
jgi:Tol biopolymer transport system component